MNNHEAVQIVGSWVIDPSDLDSQNVYGKVTLEFTPEGILIYTIHNRDKDQKIFLEYSVKDGMIITDQPSSPRKEKTAYLLTSDDKLILEQDNHKSCYIRKTSL